MNWLKLSLCLCVLIISCHSLVAAGESEEEPVPVEQVISDSKETNVDNGKGRSNETPDFVSKLFGQSMIPSLSYDRSQSISHNIGYNLGRTVGRTPFVGASLDPQAAASKVVLVLANDTPETSALPQPDAATLKRLVRNPEFLDEFVSQIVLFKDQMSQKVPAFSRTMGLGFNEVLAQAPLFSQAQQAGAIDYAKLGQTFGESLLPEKMFAGMGDVFNFTLPQNEDSQSPPSETERVENELAPNDGTPSPDQGEDDPSSGQGAASSAPSSPFDAMLLGNPLFKNFQPFAPPPLPPVVDSNPFMFNPAQAWPWLAPNPAPEGAASDISEVRVKPEMASPYKIAPKQGAAQKMNEMKLRAAMKDALNKKTIPILWFHLPGKKDQETSKTHEKSTSQTDEDLKMQLKLEAFEKQLIMELQQLQEVVKLANAMKKAQLEARKGKKTEPTQSITPLGLSSTPIYKITLDDIEKTLKDEYVQKLLQMISNSQKREDHQSARRTASANAKYATDITGNPNKRQTAMSGSMASTLSKEDMMNMMAYAYRMAATNGQEMPWLKEDNVQTLNDPSMATQPAPLQRMEQQPEVANEQKWMMDKQKKMLMEAEKERAMAEERKHKGGGHHHHSHHHHHFGRQSDDPNMQMRQGAWLTNDGQQMMRMPQDPQMRQGAWLMNDGQKMMTMPQDQLMRQGAWLTNDGQKMAAPQDQQMRQGAWLTNDEKKITMPQDPQMRQGAWLTNDEKKMAMPQEPQMRQDSWLTNDGAKMMTMPQDPQMRQGSNDEKKMAMPQEPQMRQGAWLTSDGQKMMTMPQDPQMRQGAWLANDERKMAMPQEPQMRQGAWLTNNGKQMMTMPQDPQMRQGAWLTNDEKKIAMSQDPQMRQGAWLTNDEKKMVATPQDPQMRQGSWLTNDGQQMMTMPQDPQMRQGAWMTNDERKLTTMPQQPQMRQGAWLTNREQTQFQNSPMESKAEQREWLEPNSQMKQPMQQQTKETSFEGPEGQMQRFMPNSAEAQQHQMRQMAMEQFAQQQEPATMTYANSNPNMQMRQQQMAVTGESQQERNQGQPLLSTSGNADSMAMQQQRQMLSQQMGQNANTGEQIDPQMRKFTNEGQAVEKPSMEMNEQPQEQRQMTKPADQSQPALPLERKGDNQEERKPEQRPTFSGDERQMANHDPGMPVAAEAAPQMPENAGKARHKGLEDLFDDFDLFGHHDKKHKDKGKGTVINYYYNTGGSRYPPVYGSYGGYGGGYGGGYAAPSYGYSGGSYGGGYAKAPQSYGGYGGGGGGYAKPSYGGGYSAPPKYRPSGQYGGGGHGSNAYGSGGGYRTAVGDDEIEQMLNEHQTMPKMMLLSTPDDDTNPSIEDHTEDSRTTTTSTSALDASSSDNAAFKNQTKSDQTSKTSEPSSTSVTELGTPPISSPASSSASLSASSPPSSVDDFASEASSEHERSLFSFDSKILKPFMGLQQVDREDDPWHHKPYNLYKPIFTGGGTFESFVNRYRRNAASNPSHAPPSQLKQHVLTPDMLERLLRIKTNFEKNYPFLYKTMMGHLTGDKHTYITITPPEIPEQVSYPNVELAAAEINQLDPLIKRLKKERHQQQLEQLQASMWSHPTADEHYEPLINSYNDEKSFWDEMEDTPRPVGNFWQQFDDSAESTSPIRKRESFWSALEAAEERRNHKRDRQLADDLDRIFNFDEDLD